MEEKLVTPLVGRVTMTVGMAGVALVAAKAEGVTVTVCVVVLVEWTVLVKVVVDSGVGVEVGAMGTRVGEP